MGGAGCGRIDYEGRRGAVALGEIAIEKLEPMMLGCGSGGGSVFEEPADGELRKHFLLDAAEDFREVDVAGVGPARHDGSI